MAADPDTVVVDPNQSAAITDNQQVESPFSCNVCKKSYTRIDHLARHHRSHSQERPFVCKVCNKSFARVDLLKRHTATHDSNNDRTHAPLSTNKRRRTQPELHRPRAQRACKACAEAKSRCEGDRPCLRCQQKCIVCEYPPARFSDNAHQPETSQSVQTQNQIQGQVNTSSHSPVLSEVPVGMQHSASGSMTQNLRNDGINLLDVHDGNHAALQLPTPSAFGTDALTTDQAFEHDTIATFDEMPSLDFLPLNTTNHSVSFDDLFNDDLFSRDDLDFGIDFAFGSPISVDKSLQPLSGEQIAMEPSAMIEASLNTTRSGLATPGLRSKLNITASAQAYKESLWLWTPAKDDHGANEQRNLSLPWDSTSADRREISNLPPAHQRVNNVTRGTILAMVLRTCEPDVYSHVVSNFPSTDLLTQLIYNFINFQSRSAFPWIHLPTIEVGKERAEFLGSMIAYGAALSPKPDIRKLGFAMQEAIRMAHPVVFERDNRSTRELRILQSYALQLEVGLWSGNRRKMEISESFAMPLITMVRRAGHFRGARIAEFPPQEQDSGEGLESKWRNWVQQESFKRLALYLFYRDTRSSMSLLSQPLISYAELTTSAPCCRDLWEANTAVQWKTAYLQQPQDDDKANHTRRTWLDDSTYIFQNPRSLDVDSSLLLATASIWPQLWQYREMMTAARNSRDRDDRHGSLVVSSKRQDLLQMLEYVRMNAKEWHIDLKPAVWLLHEQCLMHLCVSLDDVQYLAGKEGEEEARRIFPTMRTWAKSPEARQALFHAGQVLRAAKEHERFMLRDASAVAVYHASLVFWTYAVTSRGDFSIVSDSSSSQPAGSQALDFIRLDDIEGPEVRRFLVLGRGIPCIQSQIQTEDGSVVQNVPLSEPAEVMKTTAKILQRQYEGGERCNPPLVDNLTKLMHSLGRAYLAGRTR